MLDIVELKRSKGFLRTVLDNITSALFIVDSDVRIQGINDSFKALFHKEEDQVVGELCGNAIGCVFTIAEGKDCGTTENCKECNLRSSILGALTKEIPTYREKLVRSFQIQDRMISKYFFYSAKHVDYKGEKMVLIVIDDLTKIETQRIRLEDLNSDFLAIFSKLREGVVLVEEDGKVSLLNHTAVRLIGKKEKSLLKNHWEKLFSFDDNDVTKIQTLLSQSSETDERITTHVETDESQRYCIDIEVKNDPRDFKRKILFLYDMSEIYDLRRQLDEKARFEDLVGKSAPMQIIFQQIQNLAKVDATVLIQGETGTGKELVALAIHNLSLRRDEAFIPVNCGSFNESMIASQLFGHKRGAFTGAVADQPGVFETANGGTLFLDEIGEIPLNLQPSLLRALQEKEITKLGEAKPRKANVRLVAATNQDLFKKVSEGTFRSDLMYRIQVAIIQLPPLRERSEDIPLLISYFLDSLQAATGKEVKEVNVQAMRMLMAYNWPGNVRELRNALEWAVINCTASVLAPEDFPAYIVPTQRPIHDEIPAVFDKNKFKRQRLIDALEKSNGNRAEAARILGIGRTTLYRQLKKFNLLPPD
jgi:transcriptional regulator with PAS, ATPase and Fis domain